MDFKFLRSKQPVDKAYPERTNRLLALMSVLDGKQYDCLPYPFVTEKSGAGEYIPLSNRRPSVRSGLCRVVVDDSVSLLFSEGHWPTIQASSEQAVESLSLLVRQTRLNEVMLDAATRGSVGSVAIMLRVLKGKPFFSVMTTEYLMPTYDPEDPDMLIGVMERYKVKGADLAAQGYPVAQDDLGKMFWFQRTWDDLAETWFLPQKLDEKTPPVIDADRSTAHGLGFVPIEWVRNLSGGDDIDGACTFECAIDTAIEADYLLSQAGRGLKYSSDPTLVLKSGMGGSDDGATARVGGSATALEVPPEGDAKLLEINGNAAKTVLEHVRELRSIALETMHGNRAHADKMTAATSGVALQTMMAGLIWLADRLRISYGEGALLNLLRMACKASQIDGGLLLGGQKVRIDDAGLELRWPDWLPAMPQDVLTTVQGVVTAYAGGIISLKTAVTRMAGLLGIDDVTAEIKLVEDAAVLKQQQALDQAVAVKAAASAGPKETREVTA